MVVSITVEELQAAWNEVKQRKEAQQLIEPPIPKVPSLKTNASVKSKLLAIQQYINALEYNYTGTNYFDVSKNRSFKSVVTTAKEIINEALPIQCLEAVFVGAYLTAELPETERFPISFKSTIDSAMHRHIVLAVRHQNKWGALGLSRSDKLMYKELRFKSLSDLLCDFRESFMSNYHEVVKVYIGFPFSHDIHSSEKVDWRVLNVPVTKDNWLTVLNHADNFAREADQLQNYKRTKGVLPDNFVTKYPLSTENDAEYRKKNKESEKDLHSLLDSFNIDELLASSVMASIMAEPVQVAVPVVEAPRPANPLVVNPHALVFKHAIMDDPESLPANVFLQNVGAEPIYVEVEDPTGFIQLVTKASDDAPSAMVSCLCPTGSRVLGHFRVSAKGMIAVAFKYSSVKQNALGGAASIPVPTAPSPSPPRQKGQSKRGRSSLASSVGDNDENKPKAVVLHCVLASVALHRQQQPQDPLDHRKTSDENVWVHPLPYSMALS